MGGVDVIMEEVTMNIISWYEIFVGLYDLYFDKTKDIPENDMKDRLTPTTLLNHSNAKTGVLRSVADTNIGSIMGIGAPAHTGGFSSSLIPMD